MEVHYGFDNQAYQIDFDFRDYHYSLERSQGFYSYSRQTFKEEKKIVDLMTNVDRLKHFENDSLLVLQDSIRKLYSNSLNSVMYFFQLPRPLQDLAVNAELLNSVVIEGNPYWTLKITFDQEGGGDDFQDEFRYWISKKIIKLIFWHTTILPMVEVLDLENQKQKNTERIFISRLYQLQARVKIHTLG